MNQTTVTEVGRLLASTKNGSNSFVGCVLANLPQQTLFGAYYQNHNENVAVLHLKLNKLQHHKNTRDCEFSKHNCKIFRLYQKWKIRPSPSRKC